MCEIWVYLLLCRTHIHTLSQFSPQFALRILCFHLVFIQICTDTYIRMRINFISFMLVFQTGPELWDIEWYCMRCLLPSAPCSMACCLLRKWAMSKRTRNEINWKRGFVWLSSDAATQHNEYEIHNYVLIYIKWGVCMWRVQTQHSTLDRIYSMPIISDEILFNFTLDFTSKKFHGTNTCLNKMEQNDA